MKIFNYLLCGVLVAGFSPVPSSHAQSASASGPERTVQGHLVQSMRDPRATIEVPASAVHVGSDRWLLKAYADDIELHAFVEADAQKRVRKIYWVQFEAYLPGRPELKHTYNSPRHASMGGMDFLVDTWTQSNDSVDEPDSDVAHFKSLLREHGYRLPPSMMSVRFVHLMDHARKELMVIYGEDLAPSGFSAADLDKGGKAHAKWPSIEAALIKRAEQSIQLR